jgi:hypothetical protein
VSSSTCDDRRKAGRKFLDTTQQDTTSWGTSGTSETYGDNNHHFGGSERTVISWYISYTDDPTRVLFSRFIFSPQQGLLIFVISHPAELIATCWEFVMEETTPLKPSRCKQMLGRSEHSFKETPYKFIPHSKTFTTQRCEERQGPRAATDA